MRCAPSHFTYLFHHFFTSSLAKLAIRVNNKTAQNILYHRHKKPSGVGCSNHNNKVTKNNDTNTVIWSDVICDIKYITFCFSKYKQKTLTPHPPGGRGCSYIFYLKKNLEWCMKKSNHNTIPLIPHTPFIPHTIALKNVVSKNLSFVVLLQYIPNHPCNKKPYYTLAQKSTILCAKKY